MATFEDQKKLLLPFLKRAEEVEKHQPKIAYYLRLHAADEAIAIGSKNLHPDIKALLLSIMDKLDRTRGQVGLQKDTDPAYCEEFAISVFNRADKADRANKSDRATVATFLASSYFLDMLQQFGPMRLDLKEKQKYAAYRAAVINKALNEGRVPERPPGETSHPMSADEDAKLMADLEASEGGGGAQGSQTGGGAVEDLGLPDVPSIGASTAAPPPAAPAAAPGRKLTRRQTRHFERHQKVMYLPPNVLGNNPTEGVVTRLDIGPRGQEIYTVELKDKSVVKAEAHSLAPFLSIGDEVTYYQSDGFAVHAVVEEIYDSRWPPTYMIQRPNGSLETVDDEQVGPPLEDIAEEQEEEGPGATLPPAPAPIVPPAALQPPPAPPAVKPEVPPPQPPPVVPLPPAPPVYPAIAPPSASPAPSAPPPPPAVAAHPVAISPEPVLSEAAAPGFQPPLASIMEAEKLTKTAASSLSFEDVPTAVKYLSDALKLLTHGKK